MEQSDLDLLQTVPSYHLQFLAKARRLDRNAGAQFIAPTSSGTSTNTPTSSPANPSTSASTTGSTGTSSVSSTSSTVIEVAQHLFNPAMIREAVRGLNDTEWAILGELVACGGRANSRDLALYLTSSGMLYSVKGSPTDRNAGPQPIASTSTGRNLNFNGPSASEQGNMLYPLPHPHGVFEQSLRHLLMLGLVFWGKQTNFAGRDYTSGVYDGVLIVPHAVRDIVHERDHRETVGAQFIAPSPGQSMASNAAQPASEGDIGEGMRQFQRTLYLYWSYVASLREGLPLVQSGLLSRTVLRQVVESFGSKGQSGQSGQSGQGEQARTEQEVPRLLFIRLLLMKLGLLHVGTQLIAPTSSSTTNENKALHAASSHDFFSLSLIERVRLCYRLWLETPFWNELAYLPDVIVRPGPSNPLDPAHEEVVRARQALMKRVLAEQAGEWREMPAFIARTKLYIPYLLFPRQYGPRAERYSMGSNPYGWDFRLKRGWLTHREGWHMVEGGFIRAVVAGPLHWLGLVDMKSEGNTTAFCLSSAVSLVTSEELPPVERIPWGRLIVQPNFELVALAPVSEALLIQLDRFAERLGLEHIAQYRITKASITRAIQMGMHGEDMLRILEEATGGGEIPQNVRYSLGEWERQARRIEMWPGAALLEVDDAALLDTLFAGEQTRKMFVRRLSPTLAEVMPQQLSALQEMLWQRDYLPALTIAPRQNILLEHRPTPLADRKNVGTPFIAPREPQWRLREDGLLQPLYAVTNLYLAAEVERFTERDEETGWRKITPSVIAQASEQGLTLDTILAFLQHYCEGGIPASFLIRLKLWGGGYSEQAAISVEQSPLLYLSEQVLHDIQFDPAIQSLLGTVIPQQGRLVRVPAEHLAQVIEMLRERGFEVT